MVRLVLVSMWACLVGCAGMVGHMDKDKQDAAEQWQENRAKVHADLARSYHETGDLKNARLKCEEALAMQPLDTNLRIRLVRICLDQNDPRSAMTHLKKLEEDRARYELDPNSVRMWKVFYFKGVAMERQNKFSDALACFLEARKLKPDETACSLAIAEVYVAMGKPIAANEDLHTHVNEMSDDPGAAELAGQISLLLHQYAPAIRYFNHARDLDPRNTRYQELLAGAYYRQGNLPQAGRTIQRLMEQENYEPDAMVWALLGDCRTAQGRTADAILAYRKACEIEANNAQYHLMLARAMVESRNWPGAIPVARRAASLQPGKLEGRLVLGYAQLQYGQTEAAIATFARARRKHPKDAMLLYLLGRAYMDNCQPKLAIETLKTAQLYHPKNPAVKQLLLKAQGK
jgi:cytochrome c-type biogenesis protein CcmH/NrfG